MCLALFCAVGLVPESSSLRGALHASAPSPPSGGKGQGQGRAEPLLWCRGASSYFLWWWGPRQPSPGHPGTRLGASPVEQSLGEASRALMWKDQCRWQEERLPRPWCGQRSVSQHPGRMHARAGPPAACLSSCLSEQMGQQQRWAVGCGGLGRQGPLSALRPFPCPPHCAGSLVNSLLPYCLLLPS